MRSSEQNRKFHAMVRDIANQVEWAGAFMDEHEWKLLILAAAYGQDVIPSPFSNGFVIRNKRRSRALAIDEMAELITQLYAFGNEKGVRWSDPKEVALKEAYA